jgi:L-iditol 2-dehydrogenase
MRAAYIKDTNDIAFKEIEHKKLECDEIRVKIDACGICGTDITGAIDGGEEYRAFGHEVAGQVSEIGCGVRNVSVGQKIVLESSSACGMCANCRNIQQELCTNIRSFWPKPPYGFGEEMISPAICAVPYDGLSPEEACLSEPLGVALDVFNLADVHVGSSVLVSGLGTIGLMAVRLAKLAGARRIYACDLSNARKRLEMAKVFGADEVIEVDKIPLEKYFADNNEKPDRFIVSSPPKTLPAMIQVASARAIIAYIGIKFGDGAKLTFDANDFHFKRLQLRGSFASPALRTPMALDLLKSGKIDGKALITHAFSFAKLPDAMKLAVNNIEESIKVVVTM